jgi:glycerate 2-kinase
MKILVAPDSFKDSITAILAGRAIGRGLKRASEFVEIREVPVADGGEGTVSAIVGGTNGKLVSCAVHDPLMRKITAQWGISGTTNTAIIEMAGASGLELLKNSERNPWYTSTYGTGELILDALNKNCRRFIIGIGGSATNDGGMGMAKALGAKFLNSQGKSIGEGGGSLSELVHIDISAMDKRVLQSEFIVACDVTNPLTGNNGASFIYGAQKGADRAMQEKLDSNLKHYAALIKETMQKDIEFLPGAGAAGGLGAGMLAFLNGKLQSGFEIIAEEVKIHEHCKWADVVITGEGKIDQQTKNGKTPYGVARIAKQYNKKVIGVAGTLGDNYTELYSNGFDAIFSIIDKPMPLKEALKQSQELLENAGFAIGKLLL